MKQIEFSQFCPLTGFTSLTVTFPPSVKDYDHYEPIRVSKLRVTPLGFSPLRKDMMKNSCQFVF